ncbi:hypothetical protein RJ55_04099 [Drechmeria coniospora]|nr:hypothetical protein RJ55_04099 [Drechmeria coniospora]
MAPVTATFRRAHGSGSVSFTNDDKLIVGMVIVGTIVLGILGILFWGASRLCRRLGRLAQPYCRLFTSRLSRATQRWIGPSTPREAPTPFRRRARVRTAPASRATVQEAESGTGQRRHLDAGPALGSALLSRIPAYDEIEATPTMPPPAYGSWRRSSPPPTGTGRVGGARVPVHADDTPSSTTHARGRHRGGLDAPRPAHRGDPWIASTVAREGAGRWKRGGIMWRARRTERCRTTSEKHGTGRIWDEAYASPRTLAFSNTDIGKPYPYVGLPSPDWSQPNASARHLLLLLLLCCCEVTSQGDDEQTWPTDRDWCCAISCMDAKDGVGRRRLATGA